MRDKISTTCWLCQSPDIELFWEGSLPGKVNVRDFQYDNTDKYHGQVVRCRHCGHRFCYPLFDDYLSQYGQVEDPFYVATANERKKTFEEFMDFKELHSPGKGSLLDLGCSTGIFLEVAQARGYTVEGLEVSKWAIEQARKKGFSVLSSPIEELGAIEKYDNITAFDVVEHLPNPLSALKIVRQNLKPGGCFVATVPDMGMWHARLLGRKHWLVVLMHLQYFTKNTLELLLKNAGFSKFFIGHAPAYRLRLKDALVSSQRIDFLKYPARILCNIPWLDRLEVKVNASLFCVAWK